MKKTNEEVLKYSAEPCPRCLKERAQGTLGENYRCEACRILFFEWKLAEKNKELALAEVLTETLESQLTDQLKAKNEQWIKVKEAWVKFANTNDTEDYYKVGIAFMNFDKLMNDAPKPKGHNCSTCGCTTKDCGSRPFNKDLKTDCVAWKPRPSDEKCPQMGTGDQFDIQCHTCDGKNWKNCHYLEPDADKTQEKSI